MRLVYNVYDDDYQIESKQFDNFQDALEYAKQGLITYICEEDLDCPGCEERVVWTWDSTWDDKEAIENVEQADDFFPMDEDIEISICGPADEIKSLAELVFDNAFDVDFDEPAEEIEVECPDCADEFGYDEEPAVKDLEFDDEEELEVGEPEIIEDSEDEDIEDLEDEEVELEIGKKFEDDKDDKLESEDEDQKLLQEERVDELFDLDLNVGIDGGENNDVSVLSSYKPKRGKDQLDELFDVSLNATLDGGSGNNVNVLSPLGGLGEALQEGLNNAEFAEYLQLCKEIGILGHKDLEAFMKEVGLQPGCPAQDVLQALRDYRAELGPDFKIVNESNKKELTELFGFGKKSKPKHRYLMAMFLDTSHRMYTSDVWRDILQIVEKYVDTTRSRRSYFAADILNQVEFVATEDVFKRVESEVKNFLDGLRWKRKKYFTGSSDWVSGDGDVNFDIAAAAKQLIGFARVESNIKESISEEVKLSEGEKVFIPDYDQHSEVDSYIIVSNDPTGKYFKQGWEAEVLRKLGTEEDYSMDCDWCYYSLVTNNLEESERYTTIEDAMSALERAANDYTSGTTSNERTGNNTFIVDWTGEINNKSAWYSYTVKALRFRRTAYLELEENFKEEVKLATNKKGDYLVAAESGKGYTVFNRNNVYLGGFDGEDDQKAIDKFNKGEFKESLKESLTLPTMRASEIKDELDLHGDITFDLPEPIDESDEDGWRGASEIRIVDTGSEYEFYYEWLDQEGDYIDSDPDFICDTFEEVLEEINGFYVTVVDIEEYLNGTLDEAIKMTKDELLDKEGTTDVDLINAGRPEEERVELEEGRQPVYSNVIFYYYDKDNNEKTITKTNLVPKDIRPEVSNLINNGATRVYVDAKINGEWEPLDKYTYDPEWTPGTPEYAARNGKDFALAESVSQEISKAYTQLNREYGVNVEELVYAPDGFMATKYPNGFPDFNGDIIYSEKYWAEFEEWLKQNNKLNKSRKSFNADLEDDLTDQEFAEQFKQRLEEIKK